MRTVKGANIKKGDRFFYAGEHKWTAAEDPKPRPSHEEAYGLSLLVQLSGGEKFARISVGRDEPFTVERKRGDS